MATRKAMTRKMFGHIWRRVANKFRKNQWSSTDGSYVEISEIRSGFWEVYSDYSWWEFRGRGAERKAFSLAGKLRDEKLQQLQHS